MPLQMPYSRELWLQKSETIAPKPCNSHPF
jgi:hypothetical protein